MFSKYILYQVATAVLSTVARATPTVVATAILSVYIYTKLDKYCNGHTLLHYSIPESKSLSRYLPELEFSHGNLNLPRKPEVFVILGTHT